MSDKTIHERMADVMKAVHGVAKSAYNPHGKYKYAGHEQVTAALRDEYVRLGILRTADVVSHSRTADGTLQLYVSVMWECVDKPESFKTVRVLGEAPTTTSTGKATGQQAGIALSYAVKMAELKAFALTGDDTPNPEEGDTANENVSAFLDRLDAAATLADIDAISKEIKDAGASVAIGRQALLEARSAAMRRIGGSK